MHRRRERANKALKSRPQLRHSAPRHARERPHARTRRGRRRWGVEGGGVGASRAAELGRGGRRRASAAVARRAGSVVSAAQMSACIAALRT
eukprot:752110-Pleurochrysis_carterae.AAC.1